MSLKKLCTRPAAGIACATFIVFSGIVLAQNDPGPGSSTPRRGFTGRTSSNSGVTTGDPVPGLTSGEMSAFFNGQSVFQEVDSVSGTLTDGSGLGPRFNMDSCSGCHAFPAIGGSSPATNPQIAVATKAGAKNTIPAFITLSGPVREVRFVKSPSGAADGGVHDLFTISGRDDAAGCSVTQPDFDTAVSQGNAVFRIPTPIFGDGLIEAIDDATILSNMTANATQKAALGISGHENRNGNDGSLTRFGWKAQNKSLAIFAGEAYNVEQGVTNDLFPSERDSTTGCLYNASPEDHVDANGGRPNRPSPAVSDVINFVFFMRFLAPPPRGQITNSVTNGENLFSSVGCAVCHTPSMQTSANVTEALSKTTANLYSDLIVHNMGSDLQDGITQGFATGAEFRTAPLWGLGQRLFFLHDGRASDLRAAIAAHSSAGSEANGVIANYNALTARQKQDLLNFLRSL
jgi:CxxC motif-containing protein (DUF1111 family)